MRVEIVFIRRPNIVMSEYVNRDDVAAAEPADNSLAVTCSPNVNSSTSLTK